MQTKMGRYQNKSSFNERRKELRNNPTIAERVLWKKIRNEQLGVKFRRQFNIGYYIVDFYCHELRMIVEIDGWIHGEQEQKIKDSMRERYLKNKEYAIIHYRNEQIKYELENVVQDLWNRIHRALALRQTPPSLPC